jgi:hypothetical protein
MFCATVFSFFVYSLYLGNQLSIFVVIVRKSLIDTFTILDLTNRQQITNDTLHPINLIDFWSSSIIVRAKWSLTVNIVPDILSIQMLTGDFIVLWRAWVLLQDKRWFVFLPSVLWLGTLGMLWNLLFVLVSCSVVMIRNTPCLSYPEHCAGTSLSGIRHPRRTVR